MSQVCLTFDVDGETPWRWRRTGEDESSDLSQRSWGEFGITRGLPRILELLDELDVRATFFVPGATAESDSAAIAELASRGHEVAHHGYRHFHPAKIPADDQRAEIERGLEALERCTGERPAGYRAPAWQLTEQTLAMLGEHGFAYDSSAMGDDRPYSLETGARTIVELPVDWGLDDFPYLAANSKFIGPLRPAAEMFDTWWVEVESAIAEERPTTLCLHPEVIGRAWNFAAFSDFARRLRDDSRITLERCDDVAAAFGQANG